jgi:hypothetical protein
MTQVIAQEGQHPTRAQLDPPAVGGSSTGKPTPSRRTMKEAIQLKQSLRYSGQRSRVVPKTLATANTSIPESNSVGSTAIGTKDGEPLPPTPVKQNASTDISTLSKMRKKALERHRLASSAERFTNSAGAGGSDLGQTDTRYAEAKTIESYEKICQMTDEGKLVVPAKDHHRVARGHVDEEAHDRPEDVNKPTHQKDSALSGDRQHDVEGEKNNKLPSPSYKYRGRETTRSSKKVQRGGGPGMSPQKSPPKASSSSSHRSRVDEDRKEGKYRPRRRSPSSTIDQVMDFIALSDLDETFDLDDSLSSLNTEDTTDAWELPPYNMCSDPPRRGASRKVRRASYPGIVPEIQELFLEQMGCMDERHTFADVEEEEEEDDDECDSTGGVRNRRRGRRRKRASASASQSLLASQKQRAHRRKMGKAAGASYDKTNRPRMMKSLANFSEDEKDADHETVSEIQLIVSFDDTVERPFHQSGGCTDQGGPHKLFQDAVHMFSDFLCTDVVHKKVSSGCVVVVKEDEAPNSGLSEGASSYISGLLTSITETKREKDSSAEQIDLGCIHSQAEAETIEFDFFNCQAPTMMSEVPPEVDEYPEDVQRDVNCDCQRGLDFDLTNLESDVPAEFVPPQLNWNCQGIEAIVACNGASALGEQPTTLADSDLYASPIVFEAADGSLVTPSNWSTNHVRSWMEDGPITTIAVPEHSIMDREPVILLDEIETLRTSSFSSEKKKTPEESDASSTNSLSRCNESFDVITIITSDSPICDEPFDVIAAITPETTSSSLISSNPRALHDTSVELGAEFCNPDVETEFAPKEAALALDAVLALEEALALDGSEEKTGASLGFNPTPISLIVPTLFSSRQDTMPGMYNSLRKLVHGHFLKLILLYCFSL